MSLSSAQGSHLRLFFRSDLAVFDQDSHDKDLLSAFKRQIPADVLLGVYHSCHVENQSSMVPYSQSSGLEKETRATFLG